MQFFIIPILSANKIQLLQMCWHFHGEQVHEPTSIVVQLHEHEKFRISIFGQTKLVPLNSTLFMLFKTPKNFSVTCPVLKCDHFEISKNLFIFPKIQDFRNFRIFRKSKDFVSKFEIFSEILDFFRKFKIFSKFQNARISRPDKIRKSSWVFWKAERE